MNLVQSDFSYLNTLGTKGCLDDRNVRITEYHRKMYCVIGQKIVMFACAPIEFWVFG